MNGGSLQICWVESRRAEGFATGYVARSWQGKDLNPGSSRLKYKYSVLSTTLRKKKKFQRMEKNWEDILKG